MIAGVITPSSLSLMQRYYCVQAKTNMCGINFHIKIKKTIKIIDICAHLRAQRYKNDKIMLTFANNNKTIIL